MPEDVIVTSDQPDSGLQEKGSPERVITSPQASQPSTGRLALRNIRRQLTEEELAHPGVQKLLLDMLEVAETEREGLKTYVELYRKADRQAAVLEERLNANTAIEIFFGVGIGLGGTVVGLSPVFWPGSQLEGALCLIVGLALIIGSTIGRSVKR